MRKILILSPVVLAAMSSVAFAADLPSRQAPPVFLPPPIPVFSWTGFYIGAQVGYAFGKDGTSYAVTGNGPILSSVSTSPSGFIGGGHIGYNWQIPAFGGNGFVVGVEGDVDGSTYRGSGIVPGPAPLTGASSTVNSGIQGSARGRLGYAVDRAMFYATGGAAFTQFQNNLASGTGFDASSHAVVGWTVGGGIEYAVTPQWSVRAEYRYTDFTRYSENLANSTLTAYDARHHETQQRVQVGLSYKFQTTALPVIASY